MDAAASTASAQQQASYSMLKLAQESQARTVEQLVGSAVDATQTSSKAESGATSATLGQNVDVQA